MSKWATLSALQKHKYDYENKAKDRLIKELKNPTIKKVFQLGGFGKEHRIVVFGRSGVGKTTLILKLLGAKSFEQDDKYNLTTLAEHIRGNTIDGGAGTVTVFRYKISRNDQGLVQFPDNDTREFSELHELKNYLEEIRNKVESGSWTHQEPVTITLPSQYFVQNKNNQTPWIITDIPGINSNVKSEHHHVSDLVKAYVLQCNVLLIVEKSSQIAQLKNLRIPNLGTWQYFGRRCRLIVTHSMSEESVKAQFRQQTKLTTQELLDHYNKVLNDEGIELEDISGIYPLDYGHSWESLQIGEKVLFDKVSEAMEGVEDRLKQSLDNSMAEEEEIKALMDIKKLEQRFQRDCQKIISEIVDLEENIHKLEDEIVVLDNGISQAELNISELDTEKQDWRDKQNCIFKNPWPAYDDKEWHYWDKISPSGHDNYWDERKSEFSKQIQAYSKQQFNDGETISSLLARNYDDYPPFGSSWRKFSKGYNDWESWFFGDEKYEIKLLFVTINSDARQLHRAAVKEGLKSNYNEWTHRINEVVNIEISNKIEELEIDCANQNKKIQFYKNEKKSKFSQIEKDKRSVDELKNRLSELEQSKNEDLKAFTELYPKFRAEEFSNFSILALNKAKESKSPTEFFQHLAYCYKVVQIYRSINL